MNELITHYLIICQNIFLILNYTCQLSISHPLLRFYQSNMYRSRLIVFPINRSNQNDTATEFYTWFNQKLYLTFATDLLSTHIRFESSYIHPWSIIKKLPQYIIMYTLQVCHAQLHCNL